MAPNRHAVRAIERTYAPGERRKRHERTGRPLPELRRARSSSAGRARSRPSARAAARSSSGTTSTSRPSAKSSDLPPDSSPIQLGTDGHASTAGRSPSIGRIVYEYDDGGWNEWHLAFADGTSGWLSDAQAEYAVSAWSRRQATLPQPRTLSVGYRYDSWHDRALQVTTLTHGALQRRRGRAAVRILGQDGRAVRRPPRPRPDVRDDRLQRRRHRCCSSAGSSSTTTSRCATCERSKDGKREGPGQRGFNCGNCGAAVELRALSADASGGVHELRRRPRSARPQRSRPANGGAARNRSPRRSRWAAAAPGTVSRTR